MLINFILTHVEKFTLILLVARCSITLKKTEKHFFYKKCLSINNMALYWLPILSKKDKNTRRHTTSRTGRVTMAVM